MGTLQKQSMTVPNSGVVWIMGGFDTNGAGDITTRTPNNDFSFSVDRDDTSYIVTLNKSYRQILAANCNFQSIGGNWIAGCLYTESTTDTVTLNFYEQTSFEPQAVVNAVVRFLICARESGGPF